MDESRDRALSLAFMQSHPERAARVLEAVPPAEAADLFARTPARVGSAVLCAMLPRKAAACVAELTDSRTLEMLATMGTQGMVGVLRHVPESRRRALIAGLPTAAALASTLLLGYPEDTLGAWADPDVMILPSDTSAGRALERMRLSDAANVMLIVADAERRYIGTVSLARLLRAPDSTTLATLKEPSVPVLSANGPLTGAAAHPGWAMSSVLPVTEPGGQLVGLLAHDALLRALRREENTREQSQKASANLPSLLAHGYWQALSGMVESGLTFLPKAQRIASPDVHGTNEHS